MVCLSTLKARPGLESHLRGQLLLICGDGERTVSAGVLGYAVGVVTRTVFFFNTPYLLTIIMHCKFNLKLVQISSNSYAAELQKKKIFFWLR